MESVLPSIRELSSRIEHHKTLKLEFSKHSSELDERISFLIGQQTAFRFCLQSLDKQVEELQNKILSARGIKSPPSQFQSEPQRESQTQSQFQPLPVPPPTPPSSKIESSPQQEIIPPTPPASPSFGYDPIPKVESVTRKATKKPLKKKSSPSKCVASFKYNIDIHLDCVRSVCFYNSLPVVVSGSDDGTIRITNLEPISSAGKKLRNPVNFCSLRGHSSAVLCLAPYEINDHQYLISGSVDGSISVWDLPKPTRGLFDNSGHVSHDRIFEYDFHSDCVWSVCTDGSQGVSVSSDGTALLWDICDNPTPITLNIPSQPVSCSFIKAGQFFIACEDGSIIIFKGSSFERRIDTGYHIESVSEPVSGYISITTGGSELYILNLEYDQSPISFKASSKRVECSCLSSDCNNVITASNDRELRIWSLNTQEPLFSEVIHKEKFGECCPCCCVTGSLFLNQFIATGGSDGVIKILSLG